MGKGTSKAGGGSGGSAKREEQKPTNARAIENMNEAQIDDEIEATKALIDRLDKTMGKNDITNSAEAKAMREAFPLGVGGDGWSKERTKARDKGLERDAQKAKAFTEAYSQKEAAENRLKALEKAKKQISGTGKTQKQLSEERTQKAIKETPTTLKWSTTQKGSWKNGGYSPKIIKAGNMEIHGSDGLYTIYKDGKMLGRTNKLSSAKAYAERMKNK